MWTKPLLSRRNSGSSAGKLFVRVRLQWVLRNRLTCQADSSKERREKIILYVHCHSPPCHPSTSPSSFQSQERSSFDGRRVIPEQYVGLMSECVQRVIHPFFSPFGRHRCSNRNLYVCECTHLRVRYVSGPITDSIYSVPIQICMPK